MTNAKQAETNKGGYVTPLVWPVQMWSRALSNAPWSGLAEHIDPQTSSIRTAQSELIEETRQQLDHWCDRQKDFVNQACDLMSDLQRGGGGPAAMTAWLNWHRSLLEGLSDDARGQIEFASKVSMCCNRLVSQSISAWPTSILSQKEDKRDVANGKSHHRNS